MHDVTYNLAGGLSPGGKVRFSFSEIQAVGAYYGDIKVTLRNGRTYIVSGIHTSLLKVL